MDKKDLQLFAGAVVTESKLPKQSKLQMLEWIKNEASKVDLMGFLMDGRIRRIDEDSKQVVIDRFKISEAGGKVAQLRKTAMTRWGAGAIVPWALYRAIRSQFDKCTRKCGTLELNTARRQHCMWQCKVDKLKKELQAAMKSKNEKEIMKKKDQLMKAQNALKKSTASFAKSGANAPK
jgi:hypothetical protein